jgi:hypothetical protein
LWRDDYIVLVLYLDTGSLLTEMNAYIIVKRKVWYNLLDLFFELRIDVLCQWLIFPFKDEGANLPKVDPAS